MVDEKRYYITACRVICQALRVVLLSMLQYVTKGLTKVRACVKIVSLPITCCYRYCTLKIVSLLTGMLSPIYKVVGEVKRFCEKVRLTSEPKNNIRSSSYKRSNLNQIISSLLIGTIIFAQLKVYVGEGYCPSSSLDKYKWLKCVRVFVIVYPDLFEVGDEDKSNR